MITVQRLTKQTSFYKDTYDFTEETYDNIDGPRKIAWKLGKYEDTGLEPMEVDKLAREIYERNKGCINCATGVYINKTKTQSEIIRKNFRNNEFEYRNYKFCPKCGRKLIEDDGVVDGY